jgi:hypothetical protein
VFIRSTTQSISYSFEFDSLDELLYILSIYTTPVPDSLHILLTVVTRME